MELIFFTNHYPYGIGEQWKKNELSVFNENFDKITVIPYSYGNNKNQRKELPDKAVLQNPLFEQDGIILKKSDFLKILFHKYASVFIKEFLTKRVYKSKINTISWACATIGIIRMLAHPAIKKLNELSSDTVLYFFWGRGIADVIPFINTGKFRKVLVRMHRYDIFEYANNNYIPYRSILMKKENVLIAPCSKAGVEHLNELYPNAKNVKLIRLGTRSNGKVSKMSEDGVLRIVSCSVLTSVKRVHLMIESLQYINSRVIWRHIGNGVLEKELKSLVEKVGVADKFIFEGFVNSDDINDLYTSGQFDLFVNTSSSEGVPVSIMEAFAAGIPVLATNVGGTSEIVDESVGGLLAEGVTPKQLANAINSYYQLTTDKKQKIRDNAYARFASMSDSDKLSKELVEILKN
ncbi:MAG: glycosyltransferase [Bacteroidetes bacterium]|nr:glycosyltransferase [Bacteroidota bacterium]